MKKLTLFIFLLLFELSLFANDDIVKMFDTGNNTIMKVRTVKFASKEFVVGSCYDGKLILINMSGKILWEKKTGEGTINHDIYCADLDGDKKDEILAANGNGKIYCFSAKGDRLWVYTPVKSQHLTPMYAVTVIKDKKKTPYVVCGNFENTLYWLNSKGKLVKDVPSQNFSDLKGWGTGAPPPGTAYPNFLRPIPLKNGSDLLLMNGTINHMQVGGRFYVFEPLADNAFAKLPVGIKGEISHLTVEDVDGDGKYEILQGSSALSDAKFAKFVFDNTSYESGTNISAEFPRGVVDTAYRVNQLVGFYGKKKNGYALFSASKLFVFDDIKQNHKFDKRNDRGYTSKYTFNDVWTTKEGKMILAGSQDGGSCIYVIDTTNADWPEAYADIEPIGSIARMKENAQNIRDQLKDFTKPDYQRKPVQVVGFESFGLQPENKDAVLMYASSFGVIPNEQVQWRDKLFSGNSFLTKIDRRNKYTATSEQIVSKILSSVPTDAKGIQMWGGHGNDPLYYSLDTLKAIADGCHARGQKVIFTYPEMNHHGDDFKHLLNVHLYPLAEHLRKIDGRIALRAKDIFFQGPINTPTYERVANGEFNDVFVAAMEETTDKTQDLSIASRMGMWASGSLEGWAVRCSRDDPSFDRSRQYSSQILSNHFLRKTVYSLALGAKYIHNHYTNEHMHLYLELLDKEALFVPKLNEIVSISPVHMSMLNPNEEFLNQAHITKWNTMFNRKKEEATPMVFGHITASWMGGALTDWDFSKYAAGVIDRRQNAIPAYPNGLVLITPVQSDKILKKKLPRGKLVDKLHPIYKKIMTEYLTNGEDYIAENGRDKIKANVGYKDVENAIKEGAKKLPITVKSISDGHVGWVVAQVAPKKLRLTIVDGGWMNPSEKEVAISFNSVKPVSMTNILSKENIDISDPSKVKVTVPCGMFVFIDIDIAEEL